MQKCREYRNQNKVRKEGKKYYKCEEKIKKNIKVQNTQYMQNTSQTSNKHRKCKTCKKENMQGILKTIK